MQIALKKAVVDQLAGGKQFFKTHHDISVESWKWNGTTEYLDLSRMRRKKIDALLAYLMKPEHQKVRGIKILIADVQTWTKSLDLGAASVKPRTMKQFSDLLTEFLRKVPGPRIYFKDPEVDFMLAYYVNKVKYHPPDDRRGDYIPARTTVHLKYEEFGGQQGKTITFHQGDWESMTAPVALAKAGYLPESDDLRNEYLAQLERWNKISDKVGRQFWAHGSATNDMDGNPDSRDNSWYWRNVKRVDFVRDGKPTRVVIDLFYEDPANKDRDDREYIDPYFWKNLDKKRAATEEDDAEDDEENDDDIIDEDAERGHIEIPLHPFVPVFDLSKHLRLRTHVSNLTDYRYDKTIADKLVLPAHLKSLISILIEHKSGGFIDVVKSKSGGAVVLLAGKPGTGKTLTAEVYAEAEGRALYSVQCSQLGTDPNELEDELLKVFSRAKRWNAVLLLDEADVYVHTRGNDLQQNAIVGVFLRVLEYQDTVLFLTTNRPDDVDDAIASRCIARLSYPVPSVADQKKIWRVLADTTGAELTDSNIDKIVDQNPGLSGRDIKQLLKLALLMRAGDPIGPLVIQHVKQFRPTD